jgi:ABC-type transport system involved in multi-copper enzyme maturation permease subunit
MSRELDRVLGVAAATLREHARHRASQLIGLFALLLLGAAVAGSSLAPDDRVRLVLDGGLAGLQAIALLSILFVGVTLVLDDVESRTIYLLLARPAPRWTYLVGRFTGMAAAAAAGVCAMAAAHAACLLAVGWRPDAAYAFALASILLKTSVVGALALALSLATTSAPSALAFAAFLWVLGNFSPEIRLLGQQTSNPAVSAACWLLAKAAPDFAALSLDAAKAPSAAWLAYAGGYAALYSTAALLLAVWLFEEKEV